MYLLLTITVLCFIIAFMSEICRPFIDFIVSRKTDEERTLEGKLIEAKSDIQKISMTEDYIRFVKKEREINSLQAALKQIQDKKLNSTIISYGLRYSFQILLTIVLIVISVIYRYTPVIIFPDTFSFTPFGAMMRFPTEINGAISVPFWLFICNFVSRSIASSCR